jgi:hypothetical protein
MVNISKTSYPPLFVNSYLEQQFKDFGLISGGLTESVFMAVTPSNIDELYNNILEGNAYPDPLMVVYDRMLRVNPSPFYMKKREQVIYTVHSTSLDKVLGAHRVISEALDRMDASAEDVNAWTAKNPVLDGTTQVQNVYFHSFKVYQINETRDLLDLSSARTIFRNKIIVEYDYHTVDPYYT